MCVLLASCAPPGEELSAVSSGVLGEPFVESGGRVVLEAEHFDRSEAASSGAAWTVARARAGHSGSGYVLAPAGVAGCLSQPCDGLAPRLEYRIAFTTTGTFEVWVRGFARDGWSDSVHAGLDLAPLSSADRISRFWHGTWAWTNHTMDGVPATITVETPGVHTFDLWMREPDLAIDKIVLQRPGLAPPSALGPIESPRGTVAPPPPPPAPPGSRPNIVVIMTDDQSVETLDKMPKTSALLVKRGVRFENSFVNFPLCCPSRATFLTGQHSQRHGVRLNAPPTGGIGRFDFRNTLPVWLRSAGYVTSFVGKYLNGYGTIVPADVHPGWDRWYVLIDPTTYWYYNYSINDNGTVRTYGSSPEDYQTDRLANRAVTFIENQAASTAPFFLYFAPMGPHTSFQTGVDSRLPVPAPRHAGLFEHEPFTPPPSFDEADISDKPGFVALWPRLSSAEIAFVATSRRRRLETLLSIDDAVERIVRALEATGKLSNTYVIFTSDNGWFDGHHRKPLGKYWVYEPSVRVPLVIRGPGLAEDVSSAPLVGNIDLAPTIADLAGATPGLVPDGRSIVPLLEAAGAAAPAWRSALLLSGVGTRPGASDENESIVTRVDAVRTRDHVYMEHVVQATGQKQFELYDLRSDPDQLESRHADPSLSELRASLSEKLRRLQSCAGEGCFVTEP